MARFRTIDPAMRTSPQLDGLSVLARLVLVYLISEGDDDGRLLGDATSVRVACFPRGLPAGVTEKRLGATVEELVGRGHLVAYADGGQEYLAVSGWKDGGSWAYQYIDRAKASRFPAPPRGACRERARGPGRPVDARGQAGIGDKSARTRRHVGAGLDVDADVDATRRDADADTDAKRASPSPSPAGAGSAEARPERNGASKDAEQRLPAAPRGPATIKAALEALSVRRVPRLAGSDLAERLQEERVHHGTDEYAAAIDGALTLHDAGDAEFNKVGHAVLMKAQAARLAAEPVPAAAGGAP